MPLLRSDRRSKEVTMLLEEEKSNGQRLQEQLNSLNTKLRSVRRDKEDAETEAETLKTKLRQMRSTLDDAEESNTTMQAQMSKLRAASRKKV